MIMNEEKYKKLVAKYLEGETTLEEEQILRAYSLEHNTPEKGWFVLCTPQRSSHVSLKTKIWKVIEEKEKSKSKKKPLVWWAAAAVVLCLISGSIWQGYRLQQHQDQKLAVLEDALYTLSQKVKPDVQPTIIYQDDYIILYSE